MFKYIFLIFIFIFTNFNVYSKSSDENLINIRVTPSRIDKGIIGANTTIVLNILFKLIIHTIS